MTKEEAATAAALLISNLRQQISGAMARRLVCWLKPGDSVVAGERYGMIKYGSRADVLIPAGDDFKVTTKVGDRVYAGESVLIEFRD